MKTFNNSDDDVVLIIWVRRLSQFLGWVLRMDRLVPKLEKNEIRYIAFCSKKEKKKKDSSIKLDNN